MYSRPTPLHIQKSKGQQISQICHNPTSSQLDGWNTIKQDDITKSLVSIVHTLIDSVLLCFQLLRYIKYRTALQNTIANSQHKLPTKMCEKFSV